ncbi:MAG: hypothetical protein N2Z58_04245 [Fervidobacterium sp.]|nr:hypothetical protein [Fervidobacterium sp.]
MKKLLTSVVILLTVIYSFANALKFLPKDYSTLIYVPDLPKAYDAFKATPIGQTLLADTGIGLESLFTGILEQQLLSLKYTKDDFDLFSKELLVTTDNNGNITVVLGPVKNTNKMRKILETFLEAETLKKVKFVENYFIFSEVQTGGGKAPTNLQNILKGNLGVTYTNIVDGKIAFEGYGYVKVEGNGLSFYQKIDAKTTEAKNALKDLQNKKPIDILADKNVGGDFLIFVNREIPQALRKSTIDSIMSFLNIANVQVSGVMYACADVASVFSQMMNTGNQNSQQQTPSISAYSVVFGSGFKMPDEVKKYVNIGSDRYGVLTAEDNLETYILIKNDRMITYSTSPNKYKPGDKTFFTANYDPKYFAGVLINLEPLINNMLGKKVKSSAIFVIYVEGESIIQKGTIK